MFINELNLDLDILLRKFIEQESELLIVNASEQALFHLRVGEYFHAAK